MNDAAPPPPCPSRAHAGEGTLRHHPPYSPLSRGAGEGQGGGGAAARIRVQAAAFDIAAETAGLTTGRTDIGGVASFLGVVRGEHHGRAIRAMTLEHYPGMTERALARIANEAASRWPLLGCTVIHRVGRLLPGDPIVLVLTASPHRAAALDACAFLIDWLKTDAPLWKHEEFADGTAQWVDARAADTTAAARWG